MQYLVLKSFCFDKLLFSEENSLPPNFVNVGVQWAVFQSQMVYVVLSLLMGMGLLTDLIETNKTQLLLFLKTKLF